MSAHAGTCARRMCVLRYAVTLSGSLVPVCLVLKLSKKKSWMNKSLSLFLSLFPSPPLLPLLNPSSLSLSFSVGGICLIEFWGESREGRTNCCIILYVEPSHSPSFSRHLCRDVAFPVRREGELERDSARHLVKRGCFRYHERVVCLQEDWRWNLFLSR